MGEYAKRKDNGEEVKIGTCEDMLYLRWDDRNKIIGLPGNVNPAKYPEGLRYRLPFPDEDGQGPGHGEPFRSLLLPDFDPGDIEGTGAVQMYHPELGLLLNVTCHHGRKLPEAGPEVRPHWNGRPPHWFQLASVKHHRDGRLLPVVKCRGCGQMWQMDDWGPVLAAVVDPVMRDRLAGYALAGQEVPA